jgi:hypothetical protein
MPAKFGQCLEVEMSLRALERKIIRSLYGPVQDESYWRIRYSNEICGLYKGTDVVRLTKLRGMEWIGNMRRTGGSRRQRKISLEKKNVLVNE